MGYILEIHSLDWSALGAALGSGDQGLAARIDEEIGPDLMRAMSAEDRIVWRKIVEAMIAGRRGQLIRARGPEAAGEAEQLSGMAALAFSGIVQYLGNSLGQLEHSSSTGDFFRDDFFQQTAMSALRSPIPLQLLYDRPLFGMIGQEFPSWGGLKRTEIAAILKAAENADDDEEPEDSDLAGWLYDLRDALEAAHETPSDLVAIYY